MIIVQCVSVHWTKKSRGAPESTRRNQVPESFRMNRDELEDVRGIVCQHIVADEANDFRTEILPGVSWQAHPETNCLRFQACLVSPSRSDVAVYYNDSRYGNPVRKPKGHEVFCLRADGVNHWGRLRYNNRFADDLGNTVYEKSVFNISLVEEFSPHLFENTPVVTASFMADLW